MKSLAKQPQERQASMQELVSELNQVVERDEAEDPMAAYRARVGHEVRTRLNAIIGHGEMLQEEAGKMDGQELTDGLRKIAAAGKHLLWFLSGNLP